MFFTIFKTYNIFHSSEPVYIISSSKVTTSEHFIILYVTYFIFLLYFLFIFVTIIVTNHAKEDTFYGIY